MRPVEVPNGNRIVGWIDGRVTGAVAPASRFSAYAEAFHLHTFWRPSWREWFWMAFGHPIRVTYRQGRPDPAMSVEIEARRRVV